MSNFGNSRDDKISVFRGIVISWVLSALFIGGGYWLSKSEHWFSGLSADLILSLTFLPPSLALAAGIGWAARSRHLDGHIDGSKPKAGSALDINLRFIQNTVEQLLLFGLMVFCLRGALPDLAQSILPILGVWFLIARTMFWAGYLSSPVRRAVGFAATFHPTLVFLGLAAAGILRV